MEIFAKSIVIRKAPVCDGRLMEEMGIPLVLPRGDVTEGGFLKHELMEADPTDTITEL